MERLEANRKAYRAQNGAKRSQGRFRHLAVLTSPEPEGRSSVAPTSCWNGNFVDVPVHGNNIQPIQPKVTVGAIEERQTQFDIHSNQQRERDSSIDVSEAKIHSDMQTDVMSCAIQMSSESEYEPSEDDAPSGYMDPSDYYDEFGGSNHSNLDRKVWVTRDSTYNSPALWWQNPHEETILKLKGTRSKDIIALGGDDTGYTWHHCTDYASGKCTMQQVPTTEHGSWGHVGGARYAGYGEDG